MERAMNSTRRRFLHGGGLAAAAFMSAAQAGELLASAPRRRFKYVHVDVFTAQPLLGNPLDVFLDARGLSDAEMLAITRETYLSEATFVFPRDAATERERGILVRIFTPDGEVPFAGHPTLGTASVLRNLRLASSGPEAGGTDETARITLDLKVGQVPVTFRADDSGRWFGEMQQVAPTFGAVHDRQAVAQLLNLTVDDIADDGPIQTVSTGLPFAIVPLKRLSSLQSLRIDAARMDAYLGHQSPDFGFYYLTRDTGEAGVDWRARCVYPGGEDAATGSAAGCAVSWLVRYGAARPEQRLHVRQGVEMHRTSDIFGRAARDGDRVVNVRIGGYTAQTMTGELLL
jgi:trans-2,3-dihydro-3-hydroxyanthranilate isomerase